MNLVQAESQAQGPFRMSLSTAQLTSKPLWPDCTLHFSKEPLDVPAVLHFVGTLALSFSKFFRKSLGGPLCGLGSPIFRESGFVCVHALTGLYRTPSVSTCEKSKNPRGLHTYFQWGVMTPAILHGTASPERRICTEQVMRYRTPGMST